MAILIGKELTRLLFRWHKAGRLLHLPARILEVYVEDLTEFSHLFIPDDLNNAVLSRGYVFGIAPAVGSVGRAYFPRTGEGVKSL